jgi:hypothetical protein
MQGVLNVKQPQTSPDASRDGVSHKVSAPDSSRRNIMSHGRDIGCRLGVVRGHPSGGSPGPGKPLAFRHCEAFLTEAQRLSLTGSFGWNVATGELVWSAETFCIGPRRNKNDGSAVPARLLPSRDLCFPSSPAELRCMARPILHWRVRRGSARPITCAFSNRIDLLRGIVQAWAYRCRPEASGPNRPKPASKRDREERRGRPF